MDSMTLKDVPALLGSSLLPHYNSLTISHLLDLSQQWSTEFTSNINRLLKTLPDMDVLVDQGVPIVSSSQVVGQVSWMEDFTLFAIHPERCWDLDLPRAVQASEYDLTINCAIDYTGTNGAAGTALVSNPMINLPSKQRADIERARKSVGPVTTAFELPDFEALRTGVQRWDRHALSGDYFIWQWLWVAAAGQSIKIEGDGFTCWIGFVDYGDLRIFTAYQAQGDKNGIGTACLSHAMNAMSDQYGPKRLILTAPMLPEQAKRHNVDRYETYKRRFANDSMPVHFLRGRYRADELPYPPYYDAQRMEIIHAH